VYFQAEIQEQPVTWIVPYQFCQEVEPLLVPVLFHFVVYFLLENLTSVATKICGMEKMSSLFVDMPAK